MGVDLADTNVATRVTNDLLGSLHDQSEYWRQAGRRMNDGVSTLVEQMRMSNANVTKAVDALAVQSVIGTNPTLADLTLAMRSVRDQPQTTGGLVFPGVVNGTPGSGDTSPAQPAK
jgi:hypothetical protein